MLLIDAEDDGLLEAVAAFLEELGDLLRDQLGAVVEHEGAVEILRVVDAVLDLVAVAVELALLGPVALHVAVDMDLDDLVGREEAVADALLQRVGVNRLAEIVDVGDVFRFLRRGGQADLRGAGEVLEDFAPGGILGRAAAVAFVDDDQVEEAGRELAEQLLPLLRAGDRLIEAEIDLVGGVDAALLVDARWSGRSWCRPRARWSWRWSLSFAIAAPNGRKSLTIVWSISTLRSARNRMRFLRPGLPQPPDDLEGRVGLAGAGRHDQQNAVLALGDGLDRGVDGVDLIVARRLAAAVVEIILEDDLSRPRASRPFQAR